MQEGDLMHGDFIDVVTVATWLGISLPTLNQQIKTQGIRRYKVPGRPHTHITWADFVRLRDGDEAAISAA
jgi:hypothetical protein